MLYIITLPLIGICNEGDISICATSALVKEELRSLHIIPLSGRNTVEIV